MMQTERENTMTKQESRKRSSSRFTILELLIVISVIIILAALLLPALNSARKKAQTVLCVGQLKQIVVGIVSYTADFNDWLPAVGEWSGQMAVRKYLSIPGSKFKMIGTTGVFKVRCPMICPLISTPSSCPMWPKGTPENEWSPSNYLPSVTTSDWGDTWRTLGWGWRQQTEPLQRISKTKSNAVMFGEFGYTGKNGSVQNAVPIFYYYRTLSMNPAQSDQFLQHTPFSTNMAFFGGNAATMRFPAGTEVLNKDFTVKK